MAAVSPDLVDRFHQVLDTWGPALRRLSRGYESDPPRAEELRQEVMLQLWRALESFRGDASLRTFVFRVAHNTAIKHVSKQAKQGPLATMDVEDLSHPAPSREEDLDRHRARQRLLAQVRRLQPLQRELVLLHLEGLPNTEIAEVMGISPSNVSTRMSRLRVALTRALGGRDDA